MNTYTPSNITDLPRVILWQYEKAVRMQSLIFAQQKFFEDSTTTFWNDYRTKIFTLDTADSFGLKIWGIIVGVERPAAFTDDQYRLLLKSRIILQRMGSTIPEIAAYMKFLLPGATIRILDNFNMTITYFFVTPATSEEMDVLAIDGVLPSPTGVEAILVTGNDPIQFGFDSDSYPDSVTGEGQNLGNFDNSSFIE